jgi:hypothetical protein
MSAIPNITSIDSSSLQALGQTPHGSAEIRAWQQNLANALSILTNPSSSGSEAESEDAKLNIVPSGSALTPVELALAMDKINQAKAATRTGQQ